MPTIGDSLREARMRQQIDIADVEAADEDPRQVPARARERGVRAAARATFVKTFLRTYAETLGLDPQLLVEEYRASYEPRDELEHLQPLGTAGASARPAPPAPAASGRAPATWRRGAGGRGAVLAC